MGDKYRSQKTEAYCPECIYFEVDCFVDKEEYNEPCDSFTPFKFYHSIRTVGKLVNNIKKGDDQ